MTNVEVNPEAPRLYVPQAEDMIFRKESLGMQYATGAGFIVQQDENGVITASRDDMPDSLFVLAEVGYDRWAWDRA